MKKISICDMTLCAKEGFSFKEKIEIARQLGKMNIGAVELGAIENVRADVLLVKTVSSFVKNSVISVEAGHTAESIENAAAALSTAAKPRMRISLPMSSVGMEYSCHLKAPKMIELISKAVGMAKEKCSDVEFCALDATRADDGFLASAAKAAIEAGANCITVCDSEGVMLPDDFGKFIENFIKDAEIPENIQVGVMCRDANTMASAAAILAVKSGASVVKTTIGGGYTDLGAFANIIKNCGNNCSVSADIKFTEMNRILSQISRVTGISSSGSYEFSGADSDDMCFDENDGANEVCAAVRRLGYDLSAEDEAKVYEEFVRVASKKKVGAKELDAIVASVALQVPETYKLVSYVINAGNIISSSAQIKLSRDGREINAIGMGDGPIDAAFRTVEQMTGHRYELDDFQIQAVTEGKEAMGSAIVKLRNAGKLYSGTGISTDIVDASIRAYLNALNKIVYSEV